jgi:hypothetical protein
VSTLNEAGGVGKQGHTVLLIDSATQNNVVRHQDDF